MTPTSSPDCWLPPPTRKHGLNRVLDARLAAALLTALLGFGWQLLTVNFNYGGNLTALFCTGVNLHIPPSLDGEHIYRFAKSSGYDGQAYHFIAHDPLDRTEIGRALLQDAGHRYRRILLPGMAYLLALGRPEWIDRSYIAGNLLFLFLGSWWLASLLVRLGLHPGFAVLYLLVPATLISLDRLTVDLALTSLSIGFIVYVTEDARWRLYAIVVLAALCRDTGFVLPIAAAVPPLLQRRYAASLFWISALLPAVAWYAYVRWHVGPGPSDAVEPLTGLWQGVLHPIPYPFSPAVTMGVRAFDGLQTLGMLAGMVLGLWRFRQAANDPIRASVVLWTIVGIFLPTSVWSDFYSSARVFTPVLLFEFLRSIPNGPTIDRLPLLMVCPRIWIQMLPQIGGVLRGLLAGV